jgi:hypothetical protein
MIYKDIRNTISSVLDWAGNRVVSCLDGEINDVFWDYDEDYWYHYGE